MRPMLDDLELPNVQEISTYDRRMLAEHKPPGMEGSLFQNMGRRPERIGLWGLALRSEARQFMQKLNDMFQAGKPVSFSADIVAKSNIDQVLIEDLQWEELAGKSEQTGYILTLREYISPVEPATVEPLQPEVPVPPVVEIIENKGTLVVEVVVEGRQDFDYGLVTVSVQGAQDDGVSLSRTLMNRSENIWKEEDFPAGNYAVKAETSDPEPMTGTAEAKVSAGQTAQVTITLRSNPPTDVTTGFIVHFGSDKAFVEPSMRFVLWKAAEYADKHQDEHLVIVGNTDRRGSDQYNLSLGDRRARSVYAFITSGRSAAALDRAVDEWNQMRKASDGKLPSLKDNWGTHQYQYMLQNLGYYPSNIDGQHGAMTTKAVKDFQQDSGLLQTGQMNDDTWHELIQAYISRDESVMDLPVSQFLENCPDEPLQWLACGEQHPRKTTPSAPCAPDTAWRPNRRTELLFTHANNLPTKGREPKPETFDLPVERPVGDHWCLGPPDDLDHQTPRCDFLDGEDKCPVTSSDKWCVQPEESGSIVVTGSIRDEQGNPLGGWKYVLIAPDGKFMDGEKHCGVDRGRPNPGKSLPDGTFSYKEEEPVGVYTIEVELPPGQPYIAYDARLPSSTGRGSVVGKWLDAKDPVFDVIVQMGSASRDRVNPVITLDSDVVVVKKSYTNTARKLVTLGTDPPVLDEKGVGKFTRSSPSISFFTALVGGNEIKFDGVDNVFFGDQLNKRVQLFAEGTTPSIDTSDVQITLSLASLNLLVGKPAFANMTSVELTLDICAPRKSTNVEPVPLSEKDKIDPGRRLEVKASDNGQERAMLIVRRPKPSTFNRDLILTALNDNVCAYNEEIPAPDQKPLPKRYAMASNTIPMDGRKLFAQGENISQADRDTGFQLGVTFEPDGDRVVITVTPSNILTLRLIDDLDHHMGNVRFRLQVGSQQFLGTTNDQGILEQRIPPDTGTAKLFLEDKTVHHQEPGTGNVVEEIWSIDLQIKPLEPVDKTAGAKARLNNLGFFAGMQVDDNFDPQTERALQRFQTLYERIATGELDTPTQHMLREKYGS